jgi:hypothetical protein
MGFTPPWTSFFLVGTAEEGATTREMVTAETIGKIRHAHHRQGKLIGEIARVYRLSKNTVKKILRSDVTEAVYRREGSNRVRSSARSMSGCPRGLRKNRGSRSGSGDRRFCCSRRCSAKGSPAATYLLLGLALGAGFGLFFLLAASAVVMFFIQRNDPSEKVAQALQYLETENS